MESAQLEISKIIAGFLLDHYFAARGDETRKRFRSKNGERMSEMSFDDVAEFAQKTLRGRGEKAYFSPLGETGHERRI